MPALGTEERPVIVKVTSEKTLKKVTELCEKHDLRFIAKLEAVENLTDLKKAIKEKITPADIYAPCPCGSGKKYKFCCAKKEFKLDL